MAAASAPRDAGANDTTVRTVRRPPSHAVVPDAALRVRGLPIAPILDLPAPFLVDPERLPDGSLSLGDTSHGILLGSVEIPLEGPGFRVMDVVRERPTRWTTVEMRDLIAQVGRDLVAAFPDRRLQLGNFSARAGGDIAWSRSHNNGRDADIGFIVLDESGKQVDLPALVRVGRDLLTRDRNRHRFDVPANWIIVESLVRHAGPDLQWIFISRPLRAALLEHADAIGVPRDIRDRAALVLHEPGDSLAHDDHFHVRLRCAFTDRLEGCVDLGPRRQREPAQVARLEARVRELLDCATHRPPDAEACVEFLARLRPAEHVRIVAVALADIPDDVLVIRLVDLLRELRDGRGVVTPLWDLAASRRSTPVRLAAIRAVHSLADGNGSQLLADLLLAELTAPVADQEVRLALLRTFTTTITEHAFRPLLIASDDPSEEIRGLARLALGRLTGRTGPADADTWTDETRQRWSGWWDDWWSQRGPEGRDRWLEDALRDAGYPPSGRGGEWDIQRLVEASGDERDAVSWNAGRILARITGQPLPPERYTPTKRREYWKKLTRKR